MCSRYDPTSAMFCPFVPDKKTCVSQNITANSAADIFGMSFADGRAHISTVSGAMKFGREFGEVIKLHP